MLEIENKEKFFASATISSLNKSMKFFLNSPENKRNYSFKLKFYAGILPDKSALLFGTLYCLQSIMQKKKKEKKTE